MQLDERFVLGALAKVSIPYNTFPPNPSFSIDTRSLNPGDIFVAIQGVQHDGHAFLKEAMQKGAAGFIVAESKKKCLDELSDQLKNKLVIVVEDPLQALFELAHAWRMAFKGIVIGITGSVGKTSTKEFVGTILEKAHIPHIISRANQNTKIGAALNILRLRDTHQVAIFELGISKRGEMAELVNLVRPTSAVITNVGHQHMDGLGLLSDIALEKRTIFKYFDETSIGIVNGDQSLLSDVSYLHPVIKFGMKTTNQIQVRKVRYTSTQVHFILKIYGEKYPVTLEKPHAGQLFTALAATAVACHLGIPHQTIIEAIQVPLVVEGRFEERKMKSGGILINDCYNANPESMKSALLAFGHVKSGSRKIAVIGDMLGLGVNSPFWHRQVGRFLRKVPSVRRVILVGSLVNWVQKTAPMYVSVSRVQTWQDAKALLEAELDNNSVILVKGSHDTYLHKLVESLT